MKRKASVLDETPFGSDWLHSDASTVTTSPESSHTSCNTWQISAVPYLSSRTRKRHRDGRPDEESVHHNTIAKLFNAQRKIYSTEVAEQRRSQQVGSYLMSLDTFDPPFSSCYEPEPKQKSLDTFFGNPSTNRMQRHCVSSQPTFPTTIPDSLLHCEDCAARLGNTDLSMDLQVELGMEESDWACSHCARKICDTCAVRGDQRICLECAMPGGG